MIMFVMVVMCMMDMILINFFTSDIPDNKFGEISLAKRESNLKCIKWSCRFRCTINTNRPFIVSHHQAHIILMNYACTWLWPYSYFCTDLRPGEHLVQPRGSWGQLVHLQGETFTNSFLHWFIHPSIQHKLVNMWMFRTPGISVDTFQTLTMWSSVLRCGVIASLSVTSIRPVMSWSKVAFPRLKIVIWVRWSQYQRWPHSYVRSLTGGSGGDMGWLDGMTGCGGDSNHDHDHDDKSWLRVRSTLSQSWLVVEVSWIIIMIMLRHNDYISLQLLWIHPQEIAT